MKNVVESLKKLIKLLVLESKEDMLGEPELTNEDQRKENIKKKEKKKKDKLEMSAGGVAGVSTPLGTGPNYPAKIVKKNKKRQK